MNCKGVRATAAFALLLASVLAPQPVAAQNALTTAQWRADLKFLSAEIPRINPRAFHTVTRQNFTSAVDRLAARLPVMSDDDIEVAFARLVAMLGEAHTRVSFPGLIDPMTDVPSITPSKNRRLAFQRLPVRFYSFSDGLFIIAATPQYQSLIGDEVTMIAGRSAESVLRDVGPIISHENEMGVRLIAPEFVAVPQILRVLHIIDDVTRIPLTVRTVAGQVRSIDLRPLAIDAQSAWVDAFDHFRIVPPIDQRYAQENYRLQYLSSSRTLWVGIRVIEDAPNESVSQFAARIGSFIPAHPIERVVVDLRGCHGGDNQLFRPLLLEIVRNAKINEPGRLFVLIDRGTFSAAVNSASDLQWLSNAVFIGEPTSGAPNSFGDPQKITLPNSGLVVRISTIYWRDWSTDESGHWLVPDIAADVSSADYFSGRDPAMDVVTSSPVEETLGDLLARLATGDDDIQNLLRFYFLRKTDPEWAYASTQAAMQELGMALISKGSYQNAFLVFRINASDYPQSLLSAIAAVKSVQHSHPADQGFASLLTQLTELEAKPPSP